MSRMLPPQKKLLSLPDLIQQILQWRANGDKIVFTNGCFDILHPGHTDYLYRASLLGQRLVIGLNADASVSALKGPHRPIQSQKARGLILAALGFVDAIVLFSEPTPQTLIETISPDFLVKGADYKVADIAGADFVIKNGGSVVLLPYLTGYSTSAIEAKIKADA